MQKQLFCGGLSGVKNARSKWGRIPVKTWEQARKMVEGGDTFREAGKALGVHAITISARAKADGWDVPLWRKVTDNVSGALPEGQQSCSKETSPADDCSEVPNAIMLHIQSAIDSGQPEDMRQALLKVHAYALANSVPALLQIRTAKDYLAVVSSWSKLAGLDAKQDKDTGAMLAPLRQVSRRNVVDVESVVEPPAPVDELRIEDIEGI